METITIPPGCAESSLTNATTFATSVEWCDFGVGAIVQLHCEETLDLLPDPTRRDLHALLKVHRFISKIARLTRRR